MPSLRALPEFFAAELHWSAAEAIREGMSVATWVQRLLSSGVASGSVSNRAAGEFYGIVRQGVQAANVLAAGGTLRPSDVPEATGLPLGQRYGTLGIVEIESGMLDASGRPIRSTLPFRSDTAGLPTAEAINELGDQLAQSEPPPARAGSPKGVKARQRWRFIQETTPAPNRAIRPLLVFRSY